MLKGCAAGGLLALLATSAGAQVRAGGELQANTYTTGDERRPQAVFAKDGRFVVTWSSSVQDGSDFGQFGQRYDAAGTRAGAEFQVNTYTTGYQAIPLFKAVAGDDRGRFVIVWHDGTSVVDGHDGSLAGVFGQRFDGSGARAGAEFRVNTYTTHIQRWPRVAMKHEGGFAVTWHSYGQDGSSYGIVGQRYDAAGAALGAEFQVNTYTESAQDFSSVAYAANGSFVVVWQSYAQDGDRFGVFGQRFDAQGGRVGSEFQVNSTTSGSQYFPNLALADDGRFVVVFFSAPTAGGLEVGARRFAADATPLGADFVVNAITTGYQFFPSVDADDLGNFTVAWYTQDVGSTDTDLYARRFTDAGVARDATEFRVNTYTTGVQAFPAVSVDSVGNFLVGWESQPHPTDPSGYGAALQRFGGLVPTGLVVDILGNTVWEPGDTVDVRPTWHNRNGATLAFNGTLSNLTGPPGATYTLTDATATYGTVANGGSGNCADCYAVSVDNPAARPAQHWDASAIESITPDSLGQQKKWTLHIGGSFADAPLGSPFYVYVETLLHNGVTAGCGGVNYCPSTATTREQMAAFVLAAKEGAGYAPPPCGTPVFTDVPAGNPFCRFIEELSRRAVVSGCGGGNYCPGSAVTRDQMAVFVLRTLDPTLDPPACGTPVFNDVPASDPFCRWIEELVRRRVVTGCGGGNYCPGDPVTREQMGVFLSLTFDLKLYGI